MYNLPQKLVTEFVGTFTLIFIGAGSICADQYLVATGQSGVGLLGIAAAHGLAIGVMFAAMGHISGGHFNPAVTIGLWVTKRLSTLHGLSYWAAQLLGGTAAAYLITAILPDATWRSKALGSITPDLAGDFTRTHAMALEAVLTFFLVFVYFGTAVDAKSAFSKIAGLAIGLTITMDILFGGPFTGAAMNPARAFGPALATAHWSNHGVYWVGPLFGGVIAGFLYDRLFLRDQPPA
ncbi:MAG TPA: MIP/aquaporin family protein [Candidatus Acidoferrales bacterium]|nr:MIP/aquaporin family protein [Candidatus Acidoferrales bacterium]